MNEEVHARNGRILLPEWSFPGIYMIKNTKNGKIYVGQAQNIRARVIEHRRKRNGGHAHVPASMLYRSVRKHGGWDAFEFSILERVPDVKSLDSRESFWIESTQSFDPMVGYNIRRDPVTSREWHHSEETRNKISQKFEDRKASGWTCPLIGRKKSRESVERQKETRKRNGVRWKLSAETLAKHRANGVNRHQKIEQIDAMTGATVAIWLAIKFAVSHFGCTRGVIQNALRRNHKSQGFRWRYYKEEVA